MTKYQFVETGPHFCVISLKFHWEFQTLEFLRSPLNLPWELAWKSQDVHKNSYALLNKRLAWPFTTSSNCVDASHRDGLQSSLKVVPLKKQTVFFVFFCLLTCLFRSSIIRAIWIFFLPILANFWGLPVERLSISLRLLRLTFWSLQTFFCCCLLWKTKEKQNIRPLRSLEDSWLKDRQQRMRQTGLCWFDFAFVGDYKKGK